MKKAHKLLSVVLVALLIVFAGCGPGQTVTHTHTFDRKLTEDRYLSSAATCTTLAQYFYSCECGEAGTETYSVGKTISHDYSAEVEDGAYLKKEATCSSPAVYYKSCTMCGLGSRLSVFEGKTTPTGEHVFTKKNADFRFVKNEATPTSGPEFYYSCENCNVSSKGTASENSFVYGDPLREYSDEEKEAYRPESVTVSLYDAAQSVYGFTYNTSSEPRRPVLKISEGDSLTDACEEYPATVTEASSYVPTAPNYDSGNEKMTYYIVKVEAELKPDTDYTYCLYDKYVGVGTQTKTLTTGNPHAESFTFAHLSDSQVKASSTGLLSTGNYFGAVLSHVALSSDFIVHTGDVVQYGAYECYWKNMLDVNFDTLSRIPVMAISGNHEATYTSNASNETFKHFNYKLPTQESTAKGIYYSFSYGNAKFIMLDTNDLTGNRLKKEQYDWLVNELRTNDARWTIVGMHNPLYSIGKYGSATGTNAVALELQKQLGGIFAEYGVDLVLQGHDHCLSRTYPIGANGQPAEEAIVTENGVKYSVDPSGPIYIMNGPAGDQVRADEVSIDTSLYDYYAKPNKRSWAEITVDETRLTVRVKYADGSSAKEYSYSGWGIVKTPLS